MLKLLEISKIKDSTHTIYWIKKWLKNDLSNLQTTWKKLKKYWKVGIELPINENTNSPQI